MQETSHKGEPAVQMSRNTQTWRKGGLTVEKNLAGEESTNSETLHTGWLESE
jgi:hypothetical protein